MEGAGPWMDDHTASWTPLEVGFLFPPEPFQYCVTAPPPHARKRRIKDSKASLSRLP